MEEKLRNLREAMDDTVLKGTHFSEKQKIKIRNKLNEKLKNVDWFPKLLTIALSIGFLIIVGDFAVKNIAHDRQEQSEINNGSSFEKGKNDWQLSPAFTISKPGPNGKDVPYGLRGVKGKVAIIDIPVIAGQNNKQLVHIWGGTPEKTEQLFNKQFKVFGTSKKDGTTITAFKGALGVPNSEIIKPPYHYSEAVGYLEIPKKGIWKLDAYVEDKFFGSIVIEVQ
jgi:hypothetical protein